MASNSTSKILAGMAGKTRSKPKTSEAPVPTDDDVPVDKPQLKPEPDMEQVLSNILGSSLSKNNTPQDKS